MTRVGPGVHCDSVHGQGRRVIRRHMIKAMAIRSLSPTTQGAISARCRVSGYLVDALPVLARRM